MSDSWSRRPRRRSYERRSRSVPRRLFDYALAIVLLGLLILLAARLDRVETRRAEGAAIVNDGDTITLGGERIRLRGIDAPEYTQLCRKGGADYPCGREARQALARLIGTRPVSCSGSQLDRYDRLLGTCTAGDVELNAAMVDTGWAVAYGGYEAQEAAARAAGRGLWAGEFERPQDWRREHRGLDEPRHDTLAGIGDRLREMLRFR